MRPHRSSWIALIIVLVATAGIRWGMLDVPLERDEGEYAYVGQWLLDGVVPFVESWNMKLPGIYVVYAAILGIFGETHHGVHLGLLCVNAATIVLLFLLVTRLFDEWTGVFAAAAFAVLSLSPSVHGAWANAEHFLLPFALGGLLWLQRARETDLARDWCGTGLLLGLAFIVKQHGVFFLGAAGVVMLTDAWRGSAGEEAARGRKDLAWLLRRSGLVLGAAASPLLATIGTLALAGAFDRFWFWTVEYATAYGGQIALSDAPGRFADRFAVVFESAPLIWAMATLGLSALFWSERMSRRRVFVLSITSFSVLSVLPGFYFRPHYFLLMLPACAMLFGIGASAVWDGMRDRLGGTVAGRSVASALVALILASGVYAERAMYFEMTPLEQSRSVFGINPFPESLLAAELIAERTAPEDRVAILGSEPQIAFYADRRKASGYLYVYALMESHPWATQMHEEMIREIESSQPRMLVFVNEPASWLRRPESETRLLEWLNGYIREFRLSTRIEISQDGTRILDAEELARDASCAGSCIDLFERVD